MHKTMLHQIGLENESLVALVTEIRSFGMRESMPVQFRLSREYLATRITNVQHISDVLYQMIVHVRLSRERLATSITDM